MSNQLDFPYWNMPAETLLRTLRSESAGLTTDEAQQRLLVHGLNQLKATTQRAAWQLFFGQFKNPIVLILVFATAISALLSDWEEALIIFLIVLGSALLSFLQEYGAGNAIEKLRARVATKTTILRDGETMSLPVEQVVPGDVVLLAAGSLIPADGIVLDAKDFYVNQAVLTGETFPAQKQPGVVPAAATLPERTNAVYMGSNVRSGSASVLIVATGAKTEFGQVAHRLLVRPPETEFERGIRRFGYLLSEIMFVLVLIVFAVNIYFAEPVLDSLLFSIALAVGLTPQLLPAIISLTLAKGARLMAENGVIVRRLEAIENFGSMDILCTDKTGTITEGVVQLDGALDPSGCPSDRLFRYAYLNAYFETGLTNPLDEAITAHRQLDLGDVQKLDEIPYDFVRKRLSVVVQSTQLTQGLQSTQTTNAAPLLITKGALDNILAVCTEVQMDETVVPLTAQQLAAVQQRYAEWSAQGYRVLGVATKVLPRQAAYERDVEAGLVFQGFLFFLDPPKANVRATVADLAALGVQLKIISGDNKLVARHTATAIGLPATDVLTGTDMDKLSDDGLRHAVEHTTIFAEVDPHQKERIILTLKKQGHVVGYMGDGINDAPSLHAADVGISVNGAVDVAREAAGFVLLEKDLSILHQGIMLGRSTFANTLKYVFITTSANFGNMFSVAGASLFLPFLPMLPLQILLTNFLTDFPAMTIAGDNVDPELVTRPRRWDIHFIRNFMFTFGFVSSFFDYLTFFLLLVIVRSNIDQFRTGWFLESVLTELLILLVVRTRKPFFQSRPSNGLLIASLIVGATTLALPYSPVSTLLGFAPLSGGLLLTLVGITLLYVAASESAKHYFYRYVES